MKIVIAAIGKCKNGSPERALIDEYVKRSNWNIVIKEADNSNQEVSLLNFCSRQFRMVQR